VSIRETFRGADPHFRLATAVEAIEIAGSRNMVQAFLKPLFQELSIPSNARVLDVGCGIGETVNALRGAGYDAYGLEPGGRFDNVVPDARAFVFQEYSNEFAPTEKFDFVMSHGVIEHVGTTDGHAKLGANFRADRKEFVASLQRLTRPGGYILVACPNRLFPFDFQHTGHHYGFLDWTREHIPGLDRLTIPWHSSNYLCSFQDIARLSGRPGRRVKQGQYLNLGNLGGRPRVRKLFRAYIKTVDALPPVFWDFLHTHTLFLQQQR